MEEIREYLVVCGLQSMNPGLSIRHTAKSFIGTGVVQNGCRICLNAEDAFSQTLLSQAILLNKLFNHNYR